MGQLTSTWFDPVVGLDLHLQIVLRPPLPPFVFIFPHPYIGIVIDPIGLAIGLALTNAIGLAFGDSLKGPVLVNGIFVTNSGTESWGLPVLHFPYMGAWVPFPRVKPPVRPGKPVKPPMPVPPNDAIVLTGSDSVDAMGASLSRMGDIALSCSDPLPLPTSFIIAIPKGRPVLCGGGLKVDFLSAAFGFLQSRYLSRALRRFLGNRFRQLANRLGASRFRNLWDNVRCFFTGHPVDVATGRLMIEARDWRIGGISDLSFERRYFSSWCDRALSLGHGWQHSFDEAIWEEDGHLVLRKGDGREIEFHSDFVEGPWPAGPLFEPFSRTWLRRTDDGWETRSPAGERRHYRYLDRDSAVARLVRIQSPVGHRVELSYELGLLRTITDIVGRTIHLEYDDLRRLAGVMLPHPTERGARVVQNRYVYSSEGDLVEVHDAEGGVVRYEYREHLVVKETDGNGRSFYFGYDGRSQSARCVRTWGDGGILDHVLDYDPPRNVTRVHDSLGRKTTYRMNELNAVTEIEDAKGNRTRIVHDDNAWIKEVTTAAGEIFGFEYDREGHVLRATYPDGTHTQTRFDDEGRPTQFEDRGGNRWGFQYDRRGFLVQETAPEGVQNRYRFDDRGFLAEIRRPGDRTWRFVRDEHGDAVERIGPEGRSTHATYDRLSRPLSYRTGEQRRRLTWDLRGRPLRLDYEDGFWISFEYDPEGNVREQRTSEGRTRRYEHDAANNMVAMEVDGQRAEFRRDPEGRVTDLVFPDGSTVHQEYDELGFLSRVVGRDLVEHLYINDAMGRTIRKRAADGDVTIYEHSLGDREVRSRFSDGSSQVVRFDALGRIAEATNADSSVRFERDGLGRVVKEQQGDRWIASAYDEMGRRTHLSDAAGAVLSVAYRPDGTEVLVSSRWGSVTIENDSHGLERRRRFAGDVTIHMDRDGEGRLVRRRVEAKEARLADRRYRYRGADLAGWDDGDLSVQVSRDELRRPVEVTRSDGRREVRRFDERGLVHGDVDFLYDDGGRVVSAGPYRLEWDRRGRLRRKTASDGRSWDFAYDAAGRLRQVRSNDGAVVLYSYDALGRRIARTALTAEGASTTEWRWDQRVVMEEQRERSTRRWLFHPLSEVPLAEIEGERRLRATLTDDVGTVQGLVDVERGALEGGEVDLWGRPLDARPASPLGFRGQWRDPDVPVLYNYHRYYDPDIGRYITPDPVGILGGADPYGYVADPFCEADPLGLSSCRIIRNATENSYEALDEAVEAISPGKFYARATLRRNGNVLFNFNLALDDVSDSLKSVLTNVNGRWRSAIRGGEEFKNALNHFGDRVRGVMGSWDSMDVKTDNLEAFNEAFRALRPTMPNATAEEVAQLAAKQTWTYGQAAGEGFTNVVVEYLDGGEGFFNSVQVVFTKP